MKTVPTLHTDRCTLASVKQNDIPMIQQIMEDTVTQRFLPELCHEFQTEVSLRQLFTSFDKYLIQDKGFLWGIRKNDRLIGFIAIMDIPTDSTLFYTMHPHYRNLGYAKETVLEVVKYFKGMYPKLNMQTEVYDDNIASISVLQSCGFKVSGKKDGKTILTLIEPYFLRHPYY